MTRNIAARHHCVTALLLALLMMISCGEPAEPQHVVDLYFSRLVRDPLGTLPLLSAEFHGGHGLRVTTRKRAESIRLGTDNADTPGAPKPIETPGDLSRARLGWLAIQKLTPVRELGGRLATETLATAIDGNDARITVRVGPPGMPAFLQYFRLSRPSTGEPWRIDGIEQEEVVPANRTAALAAAPSFAGIQALLRTGN